MMYGGGDDAARGSGTVSSGSGLIGWSGIGDSEGSGGVGSLGTGVSAGGVGIGIAVSSAHGEGGGGGMGDTCRLMEVISRIVWHFERFVIPRHGSIRSLRISSTAARISIVADIWSTWNLRRK